MLRAVRQNYDNICWLLPHFFFFFVVVVIVTYLFPVISLNTKNCVMLLILSFEQKWENRQIVKRGHVNVCQPTMRTTYMRITAKQGKANQTNRNAATQSLSSVGCFVAACQVYIWWRHLWVCEFFVKYSMRLTFISFHTLNCTIQNCNL